MKLHAHNLGLAGAILAALSMLILSIANALGVYSNAVQQMEQWHMFYSPTVAGTLVGMIEAAVLTYVGLYIFGWVYNKLMKDKK